MNAKLLALAPFVSIAVALPVRGQQEGPTIGAGYFGVQEALEEWRGEHGTSWRTFFEKRTGYARMLYGGTVRAPFRADSDADYLSLARTYIASTANLTGIPLDALVEDRVSFLPLGTIGSTDKVAARFRQYANGVPVERGFVNVLMDTAGNALALEVTGLPAATDISTVPALGTDRALQLAGRYFSDDTSLAATTLSVPELLVAQIQRDKLTDAVLAWRVEARTPRAGDRPAAFAYYIDAHDGSVARRDDLVHEFDVSGTVNMLASKGLLPDQTNNPEVELPMRYVLVESPQGNAVTDADGNFNIPGASAPLEVTVRFDGDFTTTNNEEIATYELVEVLPADSGNTLLLNPSPTQFTTSEANSYNWVNILRDWTRAVNPGDSTADFDALSNVNGDIECNAFYDGSSINFGKEAGGCVNTCFSTVVVHEMGHWLNDLYGSGNGPDGFGEGCADVFAMYCADSPIVGQNFFGLGSFVRTGLNTRQFCGDDNTGCYGQVHADGEVLMGAMWKVRARLEQSLGNSAGEATANTLFNSWMNAFDQGEIKSIIEIQWLTLDDDDGNIDNATPNYLDIDGGFLMQGFPGFPIDFIAFDNVTRIHDNENEAGPYVIDARITAQQNPPAVGVEIFYRVNGGAFVNAPMTSTGGDGYRGEIPGQPCNSRVEYYLRAADAKGFGETWPVGAPDKNAIAFLVGRKNVYFADNLELGAAGWSHDSANSKDDWQLSSEAGLIVSGGKAGDPTTTPGIGINIWGNDLGGDGWDGYYPNNAVNWLRTPAFDASDAVGTRLRFNRWLTVERGLYDRASILVNGVEVFTNPVDEDLIDTEWLPVDIDISHVADGQSSVQIEWRMATDATIAFGGWNLDDVEVYTLGECSGCPTPLAYCVPKTGLVCGLPSIDFSGTPSATANSGFEISVVPALGQRTGLLFYSDAGRTTLPFMGGVLCVQPPLRRTMLVSSGGTAGACDGRFAIDMNAFASGSLGGNPAPYLQIQGTTITAQFWGRDTVATGSYLSDALEFVLCP